MNLPLLSREIGRCGRPLGLLLALMATAGAAHAQTPVATFAPAATYAIGGGSNPIGIVAADVNNDGQLDLLTTGNGNSYRKVGVLLGSSNGTFQPVATYDSGGFNPFNLAVADVNGDGNLDALTANYNSNTVGVLLGNGNGAFQAAVAYSTGGDNPTGIATADVNGDGKLDLLVVNAANNTAGVLLGNGNGTFQPVVTYNSGGSGPRSIAVADVNSDSKLDLLLTNEFSGNAAVLLGNGNGAFQAAVAYSTGGNNPTSIAVADVNGDSKLDLLTTNNNSNTAAVLLGNGNGTFQPVVTYSTGGNAPQTIAVADVNSDGQLDLLTTNGGSNNAGVLLGNGNGTFQPALTYSTGGSRSYGLVAADVNGDGKPDLLTTNYSSNTVGVLLNTTVLAPTLTSFTPTSGVAGTVVVITGTNLTGATAVRFANTAASSFVVNSATSLTATVPSGATTGPLTVTTPNGTATSATSFIVPLAVVSTSPARNTNTAPRPTNVALTYSLPVTTANAPAVRVFSQQAGGLKAGTTTASGNTVTVDPAVDFKPGETVFVTSVGSAAATPFVYQFTTKAGAGTGTFSGTTEVPVGNDPISIVTADVNGDGNLDVLTASYVGKTVSVRLGNGRGDFSGTTEVAVGGNPNSVVAADVNGDGNLDVLTANVNINGGSSTASVRLGDGRGNFGGTTEVAVGSDPYSVVAADVNGDGNLDLLTANYTGKTVSVRLGNGQGSFSGTTEVTVGGNSNNVVAADVNGDGNLDVLTANFGSNTVSVRLGNGRGDFSGTTEVPVSNNPISVVAADVDGDGNLDLLAASLTGNRVSVRLGNGQGSFSGTTEVAVGESLRSAVAADVNGDGNLDLLTANLYGRDSDNGTVSVRLGNGRGDFSGATEVAVGGNSFKVAAADVNGDGYLDLLTANYPNGTVSVRLNQAPCTAPTTVALGPLTPTTAQVTFVGNGTASGGYTATATPAGGGAPVSVTGAASPLTLTGLRPNTAYTVVVSSLCADSRTATSSPPVAFTTPCEKPVLTVPANQTLATDAGQCSATRTFAATATGTPAPTISYVVNGTPITFPYAFPLGQTTVTVTATNSCQDADVQSFTVAVQDQQKPVARTQNLTVALVNGQATITPAQVNNGSSDNCTSAQALGLLLDKTTFTCANIGSNQVTLTVTDASGNQSTAPATVTVTGTVPTASIAVSPSTTIYLGYGSPTATLTGSGGGPGATYAWSPATNLSTTSGSTTTFTATTAGTYPVTLTVTSASGCRATTSVTLTVVDARCSSGNSGKNDKVLVCHHGQVLCVAASAVAAHLNHGDQLGTCATGPARPASTLGLTVSDAAPALDTTPLLEAYPNPFTASTSVRFRASQDGALRVIVYNVLGQPVATLYDEAAQAGQVVERTLGGSGLAAGLYTIRLTGDGGQSLVQKVMLAK